MRRVNPPTPPTHPPTHPRNVCGRSRFSMMYTHTLVYRMATLVLPAAALSRPPCCLFFFRTYSSDDSSGKMVTSAGVAAPGHGQPPPSGREAGDGLFMSTVRTGTEDGSKGCWFAGCVGVHVLRGVAAAAAAAFVFAKTHGVFVVMVQRPCGAFRDW